LGAVVLSRFAVGFEDSPERVEFQDKGKEEVIRGWLSKHFDVEKTEFLLHHIKWEELEETTRSGIRFQDAVIDATYYPFEENRVNQMSERRVGLGIMGLHDLLLYCGIRYGSEESVKLIDVLIGMMAEWSYLESVELAKENGPFPKFDANLFLQSGFMQQMAKERPHVVEAIRQHGVRNVTTMTIAPTGTTGTMVGCSTGCEPYYAWTYFRNSRLGMFEEHAAIVDEYLQKHGAKAELPSYFVTAMELSPEEHVRVQGALQKWIDSSISKTCNAPNNYTVEDTKQLYDLAYALGCKGITIYRDGSRSEQVLSLKQEKSDDGDSAADSADKAPVVEATSPQASASTVPTAPAASAPAAGYVKRKRPEVLYGATYRKDTPLGKAFITINDDPETHVATEVFVNIGKAGSDVYAANEALGRAITLYLRDSNNPNREAELVKHFSGIGGSNAVGFGTRRITSVPDAIAKALIEHAETFPMRQVAYREWASGQETASVESTPTPEQNTLRSYSIAKDWCP
jgi:ribonucleoside-diphosphate reductase alpha chain